MQILFVAKRLDALFITLHCTEDVSSFENCLGPSNRRRLTEKYLIQFCIEIHIRNVIFTASNMDSIAKQILI